MKNVIKEFDKEFTVTKGDNSNGNNDYFECPEDVQPVYVRTFILKALADQKKELIEEFKLFLSKHRDSYVAIANIGIIDDLTAKIDRLPFGDEDKFEIELDKTIESKWIGVVDNKRQR